MELSSMFIKVVESVGILLGGLSGLFIIGLMAERGTETLKVILEWMTKRIPSVNEVATHPVFKWVASFIVAWATTHGFDYDFFAQFPLFAGVDPTLIPILSSAIVWIVSNVLHKKTSQILPGAKDLIRLAG
jgi:hypothetical protein